VTRTPQDDRASRRIVTVRVTLERDGGASVEGADRYGGFEAAGLRSALEQMDAQSLRQALERALAGSFGSVQLTSLDVDGEKDVDRPLVLRWRARARHWARVEGERVVVDTPVVRARLGARFLQRATRETPILVAASERTSLTLEVAPPPGFAPEPSAPCEIASRYGKYRRTDTAEGGRLLRREEYDLERGRIAPPEVAAFSRFASSVDGAQEAPMVFARLTRGDHGPPGRPGNQAKP
jgi:hypothetical protein